MTQQIESICYSNNFLKDVIFRVDFSPILKINVDHPVEFQEIIKTHLPSLIIEEIQEIETQFQNMAPAGSKIIKYPQYVFSNKEKTVKVTLSNSNLLIHYSKYDTYSNFKSIIELAYNQLYKIYKPIDMKRIGLRYINELTFETGNLFEWSKYVAKPLVGAIEDFFNPKEELARSIGQTILNKGNHTLKFTYGMHNKTSFPAPIARRQLILDYDCSTTILDETNVLSFLDIFHNEIQSLFEKCITQEFRTYMGVK